MLIFQKVVVAAIKRGYVKNVIRMIVAAKKRNVPQEEKMNHAVIAVVESILREVTMMRVDEVKRRSEARMVDQNVIGLRAGVLNYRIDRPKINLVQKVLIVSHLQAPNNARTS
jgi:hypothetical protein